MSIKFEHAAVDKQRHVRVNLLHLRIEIALTPAGDEHISMFVDDETFRRGKADAAVASGNDRDLACEFVRPAAFLWIIYVPCGKYVIDGGDMSSSSVSYGIKLTKPAAPKGRPRAFDIDKALEKALQLFWRKGYEGTSLSDLTKAMDINRPSLYAAFGDKEALFRKALDRYAEGPAAYINEALKLPKARDVVEQLLYGAVELLTDPRTPQGCLLVQGALSCGKTADSVRRELIARRNDGENALRQRLKRAIMEGDLPADASAADLARFVVTVIHGLAVQAASGATRNELRRVIQTALQAWPE